MEVNGFGMELALESGLKKVMGFYRKLDCFEEGFPSYLVIYGGVVYWIEFNLIGCSTDTDKIAEIVQNAGGLWISISHMKGIDDFLDSLDNTVLSWDHDA